MSWDWKGDAKAFVSEIRKSFAARRRYWRAKDKFENDVLQALDDLPEGQATLSAIMNRMGLTSGFFGRVQVTLLRMQRQELCALSRRYGPDMQQFVGFAYHLTDAGAAKLQQRTT